MITNAICEELQLHKVCDNMYDRDLSSDMRLIVNTDLEYPVFLHVFMFNLDLAIVLPNIESKESLRMVALNLSSAVVLKL